MDESLLAPWNAWTACSFQLQGMAVPAPQIARVARTLARLAPQAGRLACEEPRPAALPPVAPASE